MRNDHSLSTVGFATLLVAALALRLLLVATSFGTNDGLLLMTWTRIAEKVGIAASYHHAQYLNHPPLAMLLIIGADRLGTKIGLEFPDVFRLIQIAADCVTAALVFALARRSEPYRAREITAFFFASPAAIALSGFHCNSDPSMVALLLASIWAATRSPSASGAFLAASSGIKIAPLPLTPIFLLDLTWKRRFVFLAAATAMLAIIFLPAVATGGLTVLRNIFGYSGSGYEWGFCGLGYLSGSFAWADFYSRYGRHVVIAALLILFVIFYRRRAPLPAMIAVALLTMNFFSPGFGVQYLVWPLPVLPFALPRRLAYILNVALSAFLFATYTIWAHQFPWWFADAAAPNPLRPLVALLALPLWLLYGWAIVAALRRYATNELLPQQFSEAGARD